MQELNMIDVEEVSGGFVFVPWMAYACGVAVGSAVVGGAYALAKYLD